MAPRRILLIEDDPDIATLVELHLRDEGFLVRQESNGGTAIELARKEAPDLIVLDLMLPGLGGLDICRALRQDRPYVPILMLTARSSEVDRIVGLEMGADDYVTKPFSVLELVARVRALFRRMESLAGGEAAARRPIHSGDLAIDTDSREVVVRGKRVDLTTREFDLLVHFARHPGRVYTRAQLLDQVWGYGHDGYEHTVNSHINRLRSKIEEDPGTPRYVLTVWGVGYKFTSRTDEGESAS